MNYRIALDPHLELSAAEFTAAWNAGPHATDAPATVYDEPGPTFLSPEVSLALITAAATIPTTVIATFISNYLKKKFIDRKPPSVTITTISTPDGQPVLVVKQEEVDPGK